MSEEKDVFETISDQLVGLAGKASDLVERGRTAEWSDFWDAFQNNGQPTNYSGAFGADGWTVETFKPKYDIVPTNAYMIFRTNKNLNIDLVEHLNQLGVKLDLSQSVNTQYLFTASAFTRIGVVDVSGSTNSSPLDSAFQGCNKLVTIDKIIPKKGTGTNGEFASNTFHTCSALENLTIEGEITSNGLNLQWSTKLSKKSIESVISCLDLTEGRPATSITLSKIAVDNAFEGASDDNGFGNDEWNNLCASARVANWTISLI